MTETKAARKARENAISELCSLLEPGDTVYTVLRSVGRSGMTRTMDVYVIRGDRPRRITLQVARALRWAGRTTSVVTP